MKILIIYDSLFGNTEKVAIAIKKELSNENDVKLLKADSASSVKLQDFNLLIVGSPTHGGRPSQKTKKFLDSISNDDIKDLKAAAFDTSIKSEGKSRFIKFIVKFFGYASVRIARLLERKGAEVIGRKTFFVLDKGGPLEEKELEKAEEWGKEITLQK